MSSYQKYKDSIKTTNIARRAAVRTLIDNHREEFDALYIDEATKRGLNPTKIASQIKKTELQKIAQADFDKQVELKALELLATKQGD